MIVTPCGNTVNLIGAAIPLSLPTAPVLVTNPVGCDMFETIFTFTTDAATNFTSYTIALVSRDQVGSTAWASNVIQRGDTREAGGSLVVTAPSAGTSLVLKVLSDAVGGSRGGCGWLVFATGGAAKAGDSITAESTAMDGAR